MPRAIEFESCVDTSTFSAVQLQPRVAAALTWNSLARWLRSHLVSFPSLIGNEATGLVVMGFHLEYTATVSFLECDSLRVRAALRAMRSGARAQHEVRISGGGKALANARLVLCPVRIVDEISLAAEPAPFNERLLALLRPDEVDAASPPRTVPERRAEAESAAPLAEATYPFRVRRHHCEFADQWSWTEVPAIVERAREELAFSPSGASSPLRRTMGRPLRRFDVEFGKPFFSFEHGEVTTRAYAHPERVDLVHRLTSGAGTALHATVVESY